VPAPLETMVELEWVPYIGKEDSLVSLTVFGRSPVKVQDFWVPAVEAFATVMDAQSYENPCDWIGSYYKRVIYGTNWWSWHATGGALDWDYGPRTPEGVVIDHNPHLHRPIVPGDPAFGTTIQLLEHQVVAVEAIRTNNGKRVWRWLGHSIGDSMHFEPACSPADIATGIDPVSLIGGFMGCPWTNTTERGAPWFTDYPPCSQHFDNDQEIKWGVNTGVCSVNPDSEASAAWGMDSGRIVARDNFRDDFNRPFTDGRYYGLEHREAMR